MTPTTNRARDISTLNKQFARNDDLEHVLGGIASIETPAMRWLRNAAARLKEMED